jgi:hypothetical protein
MRKGLLVLLVVGLALGSAAILSNRLFASEPRGSEARESEGSAAKESEGSATKEEAVGGAVHDVIELTREVVKTERKAIIAASMNMTKTESEAFWPVYRDYELQISKVGDRYVKLVKDFAEKWESATDEEAKAMLNDFLKVAQDRLKVKRSFVGRFEKVLPATKVFRLYQIENKIDAAIQYEVAAEVPLMK